MTGKEKYIERAQRHIMKGHLGKAIEEYRGAVATDPHDVTLRLRLGDLYVKAGKKEDAIEEYNEAARINNRKGFYLKAIAVYKQILKLDETNLDVHYRLAELYTKQRLLADAISEYSYILNIFERKGRTQDAFELLKKMVEVDPNNTGVRLRLAKKELELGYEDDAVKEYCTIFDKLLGQGRTERAEKVIGEIYEEYPENVAILEKLLELCEKKEDSEGYKEHALELVRLYKEKGLRDRLIARCKDIVERFPDNQEARGMLEKLCPEEREVDFSKFAEEEAEKTEPPLPLEEPEEEPPLEIIETIEEEESPEEVVSTPPEELSAEPEKAGEELILIPDEIFEEEAMEEIELVEEVEEEAPAQEKTREKEAEQYVDIIKELGVEEALDQLVSPVAEGEAVEMAEELKEDMGAQLTKEDAETHYNLGIAYMEMELFDEAIKEFKLSLKDPSLEFDALTRLALCSMKKGEFHEATGFYERALKMEGKSEEEKKALMYELGLTLEAAGRREDALRMFSKVYEMDREYRNVAEKMESLRKPSPPLNDDTIEVEVV